MLNPQFVTNFNSTATSVSHCITIFDLWPRHHIPAFKDKRGIATCRGMWVLQLLHPGKGLHTEQHQLRKWGGSLERYRIFHGRYLANGIHFGWRKRKHLPFKCSFINPLVYWVTKSCLAAKPSLTGGAWSCHHHQGFLTKSYKPCSFMGA